jgi:hypothetical protein
LISRAIPLADVQHDARSVGPHQFTRSHSHDPLMWRACEF